MKQPALMELRLSTRKDAEKDSQAFSAAYSGFRAGMLRCALVLLFSLCGCREQLIHNLSELQANRLVSRLLERNISPRKTRQGEDRWMIEVEKQDLAPAMKEVQRLRLVRGNQSENADNGSIVASRDQQRFAFERALSAEIERTLLSMEGVVDARVHLNLPQVDPLFGKLVAGSQGSGSVFIVSESTPEFDKELIARLASGASGVRADQIAVMVEVLPSVASVPEERAQGASETAPPSMSLSASIVSEVRRTLIPQLRLLPFMAGAALILIGAMILMRVVRRRAVSES